jgi:hypothetical protein
MSALSKIERSLFQKRKSACFLALATGIAALALGGQAVAQNCPTAQSGVNGFVVERGDRSKTEVFHVDDTNVRTVFRSGGTTLLETTQFQGLFDLERIDRGRRTIFTPLSNLSTAYPPNVGQEISAEFEVLEGEARSNRTITLNVKKLDRLFIGPCPYRILQIDRSERRGDQQSVLRETDYYSPELKLIIAKEFSAGGGRTSINKFDRISPIK